MPGPKIAVTGSADASRNPGGGAAWTYNTPVDIDAARKIAAAIGGELARQGCRLVVYDSDSAFIEGEAVAGFVKADPKTPGAIIVRQPQTRSPKPFPEEATHRGLFERRVDSSDQWDVSYYRSIADADGVVLIGGANTTRIAGQVAIGARIPILALEKSGGAASEVWKTLLPEVDLPTLDEHARMALELSPEAVVSWVNALRDQRTRRHSVETKEIRSHANIAIVMFVLALALAFMGNLWPQGRSGVGH